MITRRTVAQRCHCGCPRHPTDHVVIEGDVIYCNFACHAAHAMHAHPPKPLVYEDRDVVVGSR